MAAIKADPQTILAVIQLLSFIRGWFAAKGTLPTLEDVLAGTRQDADHVIATWETWFGAHPGA